MRFFCANRFEIVSIAFLIESLIGVSFGADVVKTFVVSRGLLAPDNYLQLGMLVNGVFPGPPIYLNQNDTMFLTVVNRLESNLTMHFHGIHQKGTVESDGVPFITQDPIPPNHLYTYRINIGTQSGTYLYHAHTGFDLVWLFGALIVRDNPASNLRSNPDYAYDYERFLIVTQNWHIPVEDIQKGVEGSPFEDVPDTASILINGRSWGEWGEPNPNTNDTRSRVDLKKVVSEGYAVIRVKQHSTVRFRVAGLGPDSMFRLKIEGHRNLRVMEVDGTLTDVRQTDHLELNVAQRYSILVRMDQPVGNYWIDASMYPGPGPKNGKIILHYEGAPEPDQMRRLVFPGQTDELELKPWILNELHPSTSIFQNLVYPVPDGVDREIVIKTFQRNVNGAKRFDMNGMVSRPVDVGPTLLHEVQAGRNIVTNKLNGVHEIFVGERVQIVFENHNSEDGICEQHPWHLHGHTFYVVGQGSDSYDRVTDGQIMQAKILAAKRASQAMFLFRDVVTLYPGQKVTNNSSGSPCGWVAVRFIANNPGLWFAHCHLVAHQIMGKHFVLFEREETSKKVVHDRIVQLHYQGRRDTLSK